MRDRAVPTAMGCLVGFLIGCAGAPQQAPAKKPGPVVKPTEHAAVAAAHTGIEACDAQIRPVAGVWTPSRRREIEEQLARAAPSYGEATAQALSRLLDGHATAWAQAGARACRMYVAEESIGRGEHLRRKACSQDALMALSRYLWLLSRATPGIAANAFAGLEELESRLPGCDAQAVFERYGSEAQAQATRAALAGTRLALALGEPSEAERALGEAERTGGRNELYRPALMTLRGRVLLAHGELGDAEIVLSKALELHNAHQDLDGMAETHAALGDLLVRSGRAEEALWHHGKAHGLARGVYGEQAQRSLRMLLSLSEAARSARRHKAAVKTASDAVALARRTLPAGHPLTLDAAETLARAQLASGDRESALRRLQDAVDTRVALSGPQHPKVADDLLLAARIRAELRDPAKALSLYEAALNVYSAARGSFGERVAAALRGAGDMARQLGHRRAAARDYERVLRIRRALSQEPNAALARALKDAAVALIELGKPPPRTLEYLREAEQLDLHLLGADHVQVAIDLHLFGRYHAARGEHALAYDYHQRAHERLMDLFGPEDARVKNANALLQATADAMGAVR